MKNAVRGVLAAALVAVAMPAGAQETFAYPQATLDTANTLIDQALADDTAWDIVEGLTTEIGPRLAGTEAEARARDWSVAKLKSLGFKNVRIETFELPVWERISESAAIVAPFPQPLIVTALGNSVSTPEGGVTAEVVRFSSIAELEAAPMEGLQGKIVFVDEMMTRAQDGSGYGVAVRKRTFAAKEGEKRGAVAALIRSVGTDSHRVAHAGGMSRAAGLAKIPAAALAAPDADQLARALERGPVTVNLDLQTKMTDAGSSGNVIGEIPGKTDEIVLVAAHLDSWDLGTGAVDDGAGVAVVTAAAKLVGDLRGKPTRTIRVLLAGAEEVGLFGGDAYGAAYKDEVGKHVVAAESDFGAGRIWRFDTRFLEGDLPKGKAIAAALKPLGIIPGPNTAGGGADINAMRKHGMPVVTLQQDGTDYFDLHHTADDTLDKIDPDALAQNVAAFAAFIWLASETEGGFATRPAEE